MIRKETNQNLVGFLFFSFFKIMNNGSTKVDRGRNYTIETSKLQIKLQSEVEVVD